MFARDLSLYFMISAIWHTIITCLIYINLKVDSLEIHTFSISTRFISPSSSSSSWCYLRSHFVIKPSFTIMWRKERWGRSDGILGVAAVGKYEVEGCTKFCEIERESRVCGTKDMGFPQQLQRALHQNFEHPASERCVDLRVHFVVCHQLANWDPPSPSRWRRSQAWEKEETLTTCLLRMLLHHMFLATLPIAQRHS